MLQVWKPIRTRMTNQEADISISKTLMTMGNSSREESDRECLENWSFLSIKGFERYDFLALVAFEESDDEIR